MPPRKQNPQIPAALAFLIGGRVGGWITKTLTSLIKAPAPPDDSSVNWPYPDFLRSVITGAPLIPGKRPAADQLKPMLYIWGEEKPVQFHSRKWMNAVSRRTDGATNNHAVVTSGAILQKPVISTGQRLRHHDIFAGVLR